VPNIVLANLIVGYWYLSFIVRAVSILLVSFTLSHFNKSRSALLQVLQPLGWRFVECVIHHEQDVREQRPFKCGANTQKYNERMCDLYCWLLPQWWSSAHLSLGLSIGNKVVLWPGCVGRARCRLHKKNMRSEWFIVHCKKEGMFLQPLIWRCV